MGSTSPAVPPEIARALLGQHLTDEHIETVKAALECGNDATAEIVHMMAALLSLEEAAIEAKNDDIADGFCGEEHEARACRYRESYDALLKIWGPELEGEE
jgi:hypothetical protein